MGVCIALCLEDSDTHGKKLATIVMVDTRLDIFSMIYCACQQRLGGRISRYDMKVR